jgi:hypothetical protein
MLSFKGPTTSLGVKYGVSHPPENPEAPEILTALFDTSV